jgi:hypothetical protein
MWFESFLETRPRALGAKTRFSERWSSLASLFSNAARRRQLSFDPWKRESRPFARLPGLENFAEPIPPGRFPDYWNLCSENYFLGSPIGGWWMHSIALSRSSIQP